MNVHSTTEEQRAMEKKKTILITGATTGIGRHAALHLAAKGHHVIATGRNVKALAELSAAAAGQSTSGSVSSPRAAAGKLDVLRLDVTDGASIATAAAEVDRLTAGRG